MRPYDLPHACESAEIAALLAALSPKQRRVLREYVWRVELGELNVSDWLKSETCPVNSGTWYAGGDKAHYRNCPAFQEALEAYRRAGMRWRLGEEQKTIERAHAALVRAAPRAADRLVDQVDGDLSQFWHLQYVWVEEPLESQEIMGKRKVPHPLVENVFLTEYLVARPCLDLERLRDPKYARLVKKFSDSPKSGLSIELHDSLRAAESILDRADKSTAGKGSVAMTGKDGGPVRVKYDLSKLSDDELDELDRLAGRLAGAAHGTGQAPAD